jgi:hypothetical protein
MSVPTINFFNQLTFQLRKIESEISNYCHQMELVRLREVESRRLRKKYLDPLSKEAAKTYTHVCFQIHSLCFHVFNFSSMSLQM